MKKTFLLFLSVFSFLFFTEKDTYANPQTFVRSAIESGTVNSIDQYFTYIKENKFTHAEIRSTVNEFIDLKPTIKQIHLFTKKYGNTNDMLIFIQLVTYGLENRLPTTTKEYFQLIDHTNPNPNSEYKKAISTIITEYLDIFLTLSPTIKDIINIEKKFGNNTLNYQLKKYGLENEVPQTSEEFFTLVNGNPNSIKIQNRVCKLVRDHLGLFVALNPNEENIERLITLFPTLKDYLTIYKSSITLDRVQRKIIQLQHTAYTNLKNMYTREKNKVSQQKNNQKEVYINKIILRQSMLSRNKIGEIVMDTLDKSNAVNVLNKKDVYDLLHETELALTRATNKAELNLIQKLTIIQSQEKEKKEWKLSNQLGKGLSTSDLDCLIQEENNSKNLTYNINNSQCSICDEEMKFVCKIYISYCNHVLCKDCFKQYLLEKFKSNSFPIPCFAKECSILLQETEIRQAGLDEENIQKWKKQTLLNLPQTLICPSDDCNQIVSADKETKVTEIVCPSCLQDICIQCGGFSHNGITCKEGLRISNNVRSGNYAFEQMVKENIVQYCPHCGVPAIRKDGCPHMVCGSCNNNWNYKGDYRMDDDLVE